MQFISSKQDNILLISQNGRIKLGAWILLSSSFQEKTFSLITSSFRKDIFLILHWLCLSLTVKFICTTWPHMTICLFWLGSDACKHRSDLSHWHAMTKVINPAGRLAGVMLAHRKLLIGPFPRAFLPDERAGGTAPMAKSGSILNATCLWKVLEQKKVFFYFFFTVNSFLAVHLDTS